MKAETTTDSASVPRADALLRRVLRVPANASDSDAAQSAFGASLLISMVRCLLTYVALPLLKPLVDLTGNVGPWLGLVIGTVSSVAIVFSMRRFWRANHRLRWAYTVFGGAILVLLVFGAGQDLIAIF